MKTICYIIIGTMMILMVIGHLLNELGNVAAADITLAAIYLYAGIVFYLIGLQRIKDDADDIDEEK